MNNDIIVGIKSGEIDFSDQKIKTAYALNLCTVSVSQIIDYSDIVVLEQEYETILNNLNIEQMPKNEALLNILKQLLDTITFFRIQEGDKKFVDAEYQHKVKNAIWNAVPNFGLIVAGGNPFTTVISLASQVGIGYMNYRKSKVENQMEYDKKNWELNRSAIEQFNGLRRELFDTAWRMAEAYGFPDSYRLTERQVKQYNEILMDSDPYRRFERLDSIKDSFVAYPPFWYFMGNSANEIARKEIAGETEYYTVKAKECFEIFISVFEKCNLLRENQIASSCALEYVTLLDADTDKDKIRDLLKIAVDMSGRANDILQMCAFGYMKLSDFDKATGLLRILVNEKYNPIVNGQLLSRIYIQKYLEGDQEGKVLYNQLKNRVNEEYLYNLPEEQIMDKEATVQRIGDDFVSNQKQILLNKYGLVVNAFQEKYRILFNKCVPVPGGKEYTDSYFNESVSSFELRKMDGQFLKDRRGIDEYTEDILDCDYPYNYLLVLNKMYDEVCDLTCTQGKEDQLLQALSDAMIANREAINDFRKKAEDKTRFSMDTYNDMISLKFDSFTGRFFELLISDAAEYLETKSTIVTMSDAETNLRNFCIKQGFDAPEVLYENGNDIEEEDLQQHMYLGIELIDEGKSSIVFDKCRETILQKIKQKDNGLILDPLNVSLIYEGTEEFDRYFILLDTPNKRNIRRKTVAIIDDRSEQDNDLLFTTEGIIRIKKGKLKDVVAYDDIVLNKNSNGTELIIQSAYTSEHLNMDNLIKLIESLSTKGVLDVREQVNPFDFLLKILNQPNNAGNDNTKTNNTNASTVDSGFKFPDFNPVKPIIPPKNE